MRAACLCIVLTLPIFAQVDPGYVIPKENPFTAPDDLKRGERTFIGQCARCHGPNGEGGRGAVLAQPRLRHVSSDRDLFEVIREGIRGTEMPAGDTLSSREIWQVAGWVRSLGRLAPESVPGDPSAGERLFQGKGNCAQCHVVNGAGGTLGPDLTEIGARRSAAHLRDVLLDPAGNLPEGFAQVRVTTKDGRVLHGVRLNEDTFTVQFRDLSGRIHSFVKQDLKQFEREIGKTPMPSFREALTADEIQDLVSYLASLKGKP